MRESFIDKVYDTYVSNDFSYGIDNLNPRREITPSSLQSIDDKIAEIYAELNKRLDKVKTIVSDIVGEAEEPYQGNAASETNNGADDSHKKNIISQLGGHGSNIIEVPGIEDMDDPITLEIEIKILEKTLMAHIPNPEPPSSPAAPTPPFPFPPPEPAPGLLPIDCTEYGESDEGETTKDDELSIEGNPNGDPTNKNNNNGKPAMSDKARLDDAINDALNEAEKQSAKKTADMVSCAKAELGILKIILAILKVVKMFRMLMDPMLSIIMESVELVQLAAQCWNNPTCLATIVQKIVSKVISLLIGVIAQLLAKLFQLLGMDCFTAEVAQIMDEIREALAAISGIFSELDPTGIAMSLKDLIEGVKDIYSTVEDSISEFTNNLKNIPNDAMEGLKAGLAEYGLDIEDFPAFISDKSYRNKLFKKLYNDPSFPKEDVQQIVAMVDSALQFPDDLKNVKENFMSLISAFSVEQQLVAQLEGLKVFTGNDEAKDVEPPKPDIQGAVENLS